MTTTRSILFLLGLSLGCVSVAQAQEEVLTIDYLQNGPSGNLVTVLRTQRDTLSTQDNYTSYSRDELVIGQRAFPLGEGEFYQGGAQDVILTNQVTQKAEGQENRSIHTYRFTGMSLQKIGTLPVSEVNSFHILESNRHVLVSDEYEGLGYEISLYDSALNRINNYHPFGETGFTRSLNRTGEDYAAFIFYPVSKNLQPKLVLLDTRTFQVRFEINLDPAKTISKLILIGNFVVLQQHRSPPDQELICFDANGNLLWKKSDYLYAYEGMKENGTWYSFATDKDQYWFINLRTGETSPKRSIRELTGGKPFGDDRWMELSATENASRVVLLISSKTRRRADSAYSHELFQFTHVGESPHKYYSVSLDDAYLSMKPLKSTVLLIDSRNQIIH